MITQELRSQIFELPVSDRLTLIKEIIESVQEAPKASMEERLAAIERLRGCLVTDKPAPTDEEIEALLEERRIEKFGL